MARGGYRPGAGRPKGSGKKAITVTERPEEVAALAKTAGMTPLEYMLTVMCDAGADPHRRDRMAVAAAPFFHPRMAERERGKKDRDADKAKEAAGKFVPRPAPLKLVSGA